MKSKKGQVFKFLLPAVVFVIGLVILVLIFKGMGESVDEVRKRNNCKMSVQAATKLSLSTTDFAGEHNDPTKKFNCPTEYITIKKSSPMKMKTQVANQMAECWDNFGRGKVRLFKATDTKFCVICSVYKFEDKTTKLDKFQTFLMSNKVPKYITQQKPTPSYSTFFSDVRTSADLIDKVEAQENAYLDGSKRYAVLFTYFKESEWSKIKGAVWGVATGVVVAGGALIVAGAITVVSGGTAAPVAAFIVGHATAFAAATIATTTAVGVATSGDNIATESAEWHARLMMVEYKPEDIKKLGCGDLPVSQLPKKFR